MQRVIFAMLPEHLRIRYFSPGPQESNICGLMAQTYVNRARDVEAVQYDYPVKKLCEAATPEELDALLIDYCSAVMVDCNFPVHHDRVCAVEAFCRAWLGRAYELEHSKDKE